MQSKCDMELLAAKEAQVLALKQQLAGKDAELAAKDAEIRALKHMARKVAKGHACNFPRISSPCFFSPPFFGGGSPLFSTHQANNIIFAVVLIPA